MLGVNINREVQIKIFGTVLVSTSKIN